MSIEKITNSLEKISNNVSHGKKALKDRAYQEIPQDSVSFTGAAKAATNATQSLTDYLLSIMPGSVKWFKNAHEGMGEVQNQLINAAGTGLIAPIFIKFNPFSKTDEDTRTYTAWRQPVSAVLAVGTQAAIVIPFNKLIQKLSDIGYLDTQYNATLFPSKDYIEKLVKLENPDKKFTKEELKQAVEARKKEYSTKMIKMIEEDKIVFDTSDGKVSSKFEMPKEDFKKLFGETLDKIIKDEEQQKISAIQEKLPKKIKRGIFLHNNPDETTVVLQRLQGRLNQLYNQTNLNTNTGDIVNASKLFDKECKDLIKELKQGAKKDSTKKDLNSQLIDIVEEIRRKNTGSDANSLRVLDEKISKMITSVETMRNKKSTKEIIEHVTEIVNRRTDAIDGTIETLTRIKNRLLSNGITVKEAQEIVDKVIKDSYDSVRTQFQAQTNHHNDAEMKKSAEWIECVGSRLSEKAKSLAKCIADQHQKHVKANIDGMKRWTGLGVSLAILPVTCWLLNKIYPWFMDLAFPELSNKAATAKANKYKKEEVA